MKLRLHYQTASNGMLILESPPQMRTLLVGNHKGRLFLPFPYLVHIIQYKKYGSKYVYGGIYKRGLRVYLRDKPLNSLQSKVWLCPTDMERQGLVCTPHENDYKRFDTLEELTDFVISMWWGMYHALGMDSQWVAQWEKTKLANVDKINWEHGGFAKPKRSLEHYLKLASDYSLGCSKPLKLPDKLSLVNVDYKKLI